MSTPDYNYIFKISLYYDGSTSELVDLILKQCPGANQEVVNSHVERMNLNGRRFEVGFNSRDGQPFSFDGIFLENDNHEHT